MFILAGQHLKFGGPPHDFLELRAYNSTTSYSTLHDLDKPCIHELELMGTKLLTPVYD